MGTLLLAAGGGGDALGALLLRRRLDEISTPPLIATYAWERLRIDPLPGPRGRAGFQGLGQLAGHAVEILPTTSTRAPGRSSLPRLAADSDARLLLLDPGDGARGLTTQLDHLSDALDIDRVLLVDLGGDIVARGDEPGLRSPLADALSLAAAASLGLPGRVAVSGLGADGELTESEVLARIRQLGGRHTHTLDAADTAPISKILEWHPSEVTALTAAAALGLRDTVEIGRGGRPVTLTDLTPSVWSLDLHHTANHNPLARALADTGSLDEAHTIAEDVATSELTYERTKAQRHEQHRVQPHRDARDAVTDTAGTLQARGIHYATTRCLAEALLTEGHTEAALEEVLAQAHDARRGPLWNLQVLARL